MAVYHKNNKPCIYIWPDNLGTLDWMFKRRLRETLLKYHRYKTLFFFELEIFLERNLMKIILLIALIYFIKDIKVRIIFSFLLVIFLFFEIKKEVSKLRKLKKSKWVSGEKYKKESEKTDVVDQLKSSLEDLKHGRIKKFA